MDALSRFVIVAIPVSLALQACCCDENTGDHDSGPAGGVAGTGAGTGGVTRAPLAMPAAAPVAPLEPVAPLAPVAPPAVVVVRLNGLSMCRLTGWLSLTSAARCRFGSRRTKAVCLSR